MYVPERVVVASCSGSLSAYVHVCMCQSELLLVVAPRSGSLSTYVHV